MDMNQGQGQPNLTSQQQDQNILPPGRNWKLIIVFILLLILVGTGSYYLGIKQNKPVIQTQVIPTTIQISASPTPDPTTGWKTYISQNYGYELKYPTDWNYSSEIMSEAFSKTFMKGSDNFGCAFSIGVQNSAGFDNYMKKFMAMQKENSINVTTTTIKNKNNTIIIKEELPDFIKAEGIYATYYIKNENGKYSYDIDTSIDKTIINKDGYNVSYGTVNDKNCLRIFDGMISTFKVIN